jgi:hypothetical protein
MSVYSTQPLELQGVATYPLAERKSKVSSADFARPLAKDPLFSQFWDALPNILAAAEIKELVGRLHAARESGKPILWGMGGHVIKVGLAPVLIDLMRHGWIQGLAMNGSAAIHDFEIALSGSTSEEVETELRSGHFGMAEETGAGLNRAFQEGAAAELGAGESIGCWLAARTPPFGHLSLLHSAYERRIPVTVHIAIGGDIIHNHPSVSGEALGKCSHRDFRLLAALVSGIHDGGAYLNLGSAVILPEVFLKTVTLVRNTGRQLERFTTANFDFIQHYRPTQNVVKRPTAGGGRGFAFTGHHEIMLPLLAAALKLQT